MNRTREAARARFCVALSIVFFLSAVASALLIGNGEYLALVLVVLGGFLMVASSIMREHSRVPRRVRAEPQVIEEQL